MRTVVRRYLRSKFFQRGSMCLVLGLLAWPADLDAQMREGKGPLARGEAQRRPPPMPEGVKMETGIVYGTAGEGGRDLRLDLFLPEADDSGKLRPAVVFIHGGAWTGGSPSAFYRQSAYLASKGFVCACIEYRLSGEAKFPAAVQDSKCAVRWMRANAENYRIDPDRIAAGGGSAGGHLTAMLGATAGQKDLEGKGGHESFPSHVNACVVFNGVFDIRGVRDKPPVLQFLGGTPDELPEAYEKASPMAHVSKNCPPFLLLHGTNDQVIPIQQARNFAAKLKELGCQVELVEYEGAQHSFFNRSPHYEQTLQKMEDFLTGVFGVSNAPPKEE